MIGVWNFIFLVKLIFDVSSCFLLFCWVLLNIFVGEGVREFGIEYGMF